MANSNVRFYKLNVLPNFDVSKRGIFVHVTGTMKNIPWTPTNHPKEVDPNTLLMNIKSDTLVQWLSERHITSIESGLWFGGENGWELLSNETNSAAINAAIKAKIDTLNAGGFTQATIGANTTEGSESATGSTLTILGIKETNGLIEQDNANDVNIAIDGVYNESTNKIATQSTINKKIGTLDASAFQTVTKSTSGVNTVLTFNGIKEVDGIISQGVTENAETFTVGDAKLNIQIGSADAFEVFSANKQSDSTIKLDGYVFKKEGDTISVITPTTVTSSNRLVTEQDIASLGGAMHYKTTIANAGAWPTTVKAGDVYIATGNFEKEGQVIESGDMIVFNSESATNFTVVQSNITSGIKSGQIAKNDGDLSPDNMVIATSNGIKTISITETQLTGANENTRTLSVANSGDADGVFHHAVTVSDTFKVIGKDFTKSINISSANRSIEIAENGNTGVMVDLVWNTSIE